MVTGYDRVVIREHAFIALGSNLGDSRAILDSAIHAISMLPATKLSEFSSIYNSSPLSDCSQPDYLNAVIKIETALEPLELLDHLMSIEREHGRVRGPQRWAARTLDLDILLYGSLEIQTEKLWLPHREMHNRDFVLVPLAEIAAGITIPGRGSIGTLLDKCPQRGLVRVQGRHVSRKSEFSSEEPFRTEGGNGRELEEGIDPA